MPLFIRKFIVDAVETGLAALVALPFAIPTSFEEGKALGIAAAFALVGGALSAARRAIPGFLAWLNAKLGTSEA